MDITGGDALLRRDAVVRGVTDNDLRTHVRRGDIESANRGLYLPAGALASMDDRAKHLVAVRGSVVRSGPDVVVSRESAAMLHGFEMWEPNLETVHSSSPRTSGGHVNAIRHLHADGLPAWEVAEVGGLRVTSTARTVADLARCLDFEHAVCVGDSALRMAAVSVDEIGKALASTTSKAGKRRATKVLEFLDARAESIGESRSRVYLDRYDFPAPTLQIDLFDSDGSFLARPDFCWESEGVIGEFDGVAKYREFVRAGERPADVVVREKRREDRLRSHGWVVVRWTWSDLYSSETAARIERCFALARGLPAPTTRTVQ